MAYVPIVLSADLKTQIYPEAQILISRADTTILDMAINSALSEAQMWLSNKYDLVQMFGSPALGTSATFTDQMLLEMVKSIAVWNLVRLAPSTVELPITRTRYEDAIHNLKAIQAGKASPPGWPFKDTSTQPQAPQGDAIQWHSNRKISTHY